MTQHTAATDPNANPAAARKRWLRLAALAAVMLVPLAFVGLFVSAVSQGNDAPGRIPAAIVNDDSLITSTAADGTETNVFAGRQLVTELTGPESAGFDWTITNEEDAKAALKSGDVYAILTVPSDFSKSVVSLQSANPVKATLTVETDDAHSYLTGSLLQVVGQTMAGTFGRQITEQYITGLTSGLGELGTSLATAADGATRLGAGAGQLGDGASRLAEGADALGGGAGQLQNGLRSYTGGVSSLSAGLGSLNSGAAALGQLSSGVAQYTGGVATLAGNTVPVLQQLQALTPDPAQAAQIQQLIDGFAATTAAGSQLSQQTASAVSGLQGGIAQSAAGAAKLAAGGPALVDGAGGLASGASEISTGATALATGAADLATGAGTLSSGLETGAASVPSSDTDAAATVAGVAAEPVTLTVKTVNEVSDIGQIVATFFVPLGLWIGALAVFLVLRPVTRRALTSTAHDGRIVVSALARACVVTGAQAVLLVLLLHTAAGVSWSLLPATLSFSLLTAFAFTAFHYLLTAAFGRAGLVISLFLLAVQITATGGIYPIEVLAEPFQAISPLLPLTYAVSGTQAILSGGSVAPVVTAAVVLAVFGLGSTLLALVATKRSRTARALGLMPVVTASRAA